MADADPERPTKNSNAEVFSRALQPFTFQNNPAASSANQSGQTTTHAGNFQNVDLRSRNSQYANRQGSFPGASSRFQQGEPEGASLAPSRFQENKLAEPKPTFFTNPVEYVFGGHDDDVSTIGGGRFGTGGSVCDDSTIATTPTLASEFRRQGRNPHAIIEVDEESDEDSGDNNNNNKQTDAISKSNPPRITPKSNPRESYGLGSRPSAEGWKQYGGGGKSISSNVMGAPRRYSSTGTGLEGPPRVSVNQNLQSEWEMYGGGSGGGVSGGGDRSVAGETMFTDDQSDMDSRRYHGEPHRQDVRRQSTESYGIDAPSQSGELHSSSYRPMPPPPSRRVPPPSHGMMPTRAGTKSISSSGTSFSGGQSVMENSVFDSSTIATSTTMANQFRADSQQPIIEVDEDEETTVVSESLDDTTEVSSDTIITELSNKEPPSVQPSTLSDNDSHFTDGQLTYPSLQSSFAGMPSISEENSAHMADASSIVDDDEPNIADLSKLNNQQATDDNMYIGGDETSKVLSGERAPLEATSAHSSEGRQSFAKSLSTASTTGTGSRVLLEGSVIDRSQRSWKSEDFVQQNRREQFRRQSFGGSRQSFGGSREGMGSDASVLPADPVELTLTRGGPTMTQGMSGKPVIHVNLHSDRDGSISRMEYTTPVNEMLDEEGSITTASSGTTFFGNFRGGSTRSLSGNTVYSRGSGGVYSKGSGIGAGVGVGGFQGGRELSWYQYYNQRSELIRLCSSRRCVRYNALVFLVLCICISVTIGLVASVENGQTTANSRFPVGLGGLNAPPAQGMKLPLNIENHIEDWFRPSGNYIFQKEVVPFFWQIPLGGASLFQDMAGSCLRFTLASDVGAKAGRLSGISNETIQEIRVYGANYVNVDTTTEKGIDHAKNLNLIPSSLPDIVFSPLLHSAVSKLYDKTHTANLVVTMRHPVDRAVGMYNYLRLNDALVATMTLEDYASSNFIDNNVMTRYLVNKLGGSLTEDDLKLAKEVLRRKALVGLYEDMTATIEHFERYFSWTPVSDEAISCQHKRIADGIDKDATLDSGSAAYTLITQQVRFDLQLYQYVRNILYPYQYEAIRRQHKVSNIKN